MFEYIVEFPSPLTEKEKAMIYGFAGEVIRCKDCKHYEERKLKDWCRRHNHDTDEFCYCTWAEREKEWLFT